MQISSKVEIQVCKAFSHLHFNLGRDLEKEVTRLKSDLEKMKVQQEETLSRLQGKQIETKSKSRGNPIVCARLELNFGQTLMM